MNEATSMYQKRCSAAVEGFGLLSAAWFVRPYIFFILSPINDKKKPAVSPSLSLCGSQATFTSLRRWRSSPLFAVWAPQQLDSPAKLHTDHMTTQRHTAPVHSQNVSSVIQSVEIIKRLFYFDVCAVSKSQALWQNSPMINSVTSGFVFW